jgi:hypothetical protein
MSVVIERNLLPQRSKQLLCCGRPKFSVQPPNQGAKHFLKPINPIFVSHLFNSKFAGQQPIDVYE